MKSSWKIPEEYRLARYILWSIGILYTGLVLWIGLTYHRIAYARGPEYDGYFAQAGAIAQGIPYADPFHPPGYATALAVINLLTGLDVFVAGKILSALCAGVFVLIIATWAVSHYNTLAGVALAILLAFNPVLLKSALSVDSDMMFATLIQLILVLTLKYRRRPVSGLAFCIGLASGAVTLTRYNGMIAGLWAFGLIAFYSWRQSGFLRRTGLFSIGVAIPIAFGVWLTRDTPGDILTNLNWRNLTYGLYDWQNKTGGAFFDFIQQEPFPFRGAYDIITSYPSDLLFYWLGELGASLYALCAFRDLSPSSITLGDFQIGLLAPLLIIGFWQSWRKRNVETSLLVGFIILYLLPVALIEYIPRYTLPVSGILYLWVCAPMMTRPYWKGKPVTWRRHGFALTALLCVWGYLSLPQRYDLVRWSMIEKEPRDTLAALSFLDEYNPGAKRIMTDYQFTGHFSASPYAHKYVWLKDYRFHSNRSPWTTEWELLKTWIQDERVNYLIAGEVFTLNGLYHEFHPSIRPPSWLVPVRQIGKTMIYRIIEQDDPEP